MNYTHLPPYGHAMCPHCRTQFDLAGALPTFIEKCPHNDHALYVMCPQCAGQYQKASSQTRQAMSNLCFVNYKIKGRSPGGNFFPWAVTTTLTLALNNYDIVAAIENGHGLSRDKYFEMCASEKPYSTCPEVCVWLHRLRPEAMMKICDLIASGLVLVPIPNGQKGPLSANWNLPHNCVSDVPAAVRLVGMNIGLAHAYCTPSPTCAIDIDQYLHAKAWLATHGVELEPLLIDSASVVIWSGKRHSLKLVYRLPTGMPPLESKKINGPDGKSIIEFRCATKEGKTVQDVLPPSIHPDGHQYQWVGAGSPLALPTIPLSLLKVWGMLIANSNRVSQRMFGIQATSTKPETPRQIALVEEALQYVSADCSYENWRNIIWSIQSTGWKRAEAIAQAWSSSAPDRYSDDAFWLVANSYMPNHSNPISLGTVDYHARAGGWNG